MRLIPIYCFPDWGKFKLLQIVVIIITSNNYVLTILSLDTLFFIAV